MKAHVLTIKTDRGVTLLVRLVEQGDQYGKDWCLTHDRDEPLVEFYAASYSETQFGYFISSYYLSTLMKGNEGLCLRGDAREYDVDDKAMARVREWLKEFQS